ncbi:MULTISPECIES: Uma2 family endonuclease [Streptomyces]|uniref:Uma2 family endonuclease n=1 Tax=Streptomyces ramulosus TaxID=47762 RepID=A0ABW1FI08_9ACTN
MSALTVDRAPDHDREWDGLVRIWEQTKAPVGCKVEIIEGIVTVSRPPDGPHCLIVEKIHRRLCAALSDEWGIYRTLGTEIPFRNGLYVPDLAVVPDAVVRGEQGRRIPASAAELMVEVTSKCNASHDRIAKAAGYARAGVPLYLLVDRWAPGGPTITLYGEPAGDVYRVLQAVKFGDGLALPAPIDLLLDTGIFPTG